ncbi:hypothetical protein [Actinoplanes sp. NPDC026623]|uniref:hypothetical protein n=1 Tax=Actinoplanes sp. NPDC026623 TaxID=3155610 RepID=UPI0033EE6B72
MIRHTGTAAVAAVLALGLLTACDDAGPPTAGPWPGAAASGSAAPTAGVVPGAAGSGSAAPAAPIGCAAPGSARPKGGHPVVADGRTITGVAPGLDLPPGSRIEHAADSGNAATVTVSAPEPERVLEHYRRQAPECGYRIVNDEGSVLYLTGHGWGVQVVAQGSATTVAFRAAPEEPMG